MSGQESSPAMGQRVGIDDVDRLARSESHYLVKDRVEDPLIAAALDIAQVRRAHRVVDMQQGIRCVEQWLLLVNVDGSESGTPRLERSRESTRLDQTGAAGVHQQSGRFHAG